MSLWGAIGSIGGSLLGGLFGSNQAKKQEKLQREFAQHGVSWKVEDAKRAGIHPLAALGAQTHAYSPVSIGTDMGANLANAGQNLGSALAAGSTKVEKAAQQLQLQRAALENQLLEQQIAGQAKMNLINQPGRQVTVPPVDGQKSLIPGQSAADLVNFNPMDVTAYKEGAPYAEPAGVSEVGHLIASDGSRPVVMSEQAKERLEEDFLGMIAWNARNRLMPALGASGSPPSTSPGKGKVWVYDPVRTAYVAVDSRLASPFKDMYNKARNTPFRLNRGRGKVW